MDGQDSIVAQANFKGFSLLGSYNLKCISLSLSSLDPSASYHHAVKERTGDDKERVEEEKLIKERFLRGQVEKARSNMGSRGANVFLSRANRMKQKLQSALEANILEIEDVSHQHAGHAAIKALQGDAIETHFNLKIISPKFEGQSLVKRHRMVYALLDDELKSGLHAVSIVAKTPKESGLSN